MRLATELIVIYKGWRRFLKFFGAIGSAFAAGIMAFFAGLVAPVTLWKRFVGHHQNSSSADFPIMVFGLIFGGILGLVTIYITGRWLWPTKEDQE